MTIRPGVRVTLWNSRPGATNTTNFVLTDPGGRISSLTERKQRLKRQKFEAEKRAMAATGNARKRQHLRVDFIRWRIGRLSRDAIAKTRKRLLSMSTGWERITAYTEPGRSQSLRRLTYEQLEKISELIGTATDITFTRITIDIR